MGNDGYIANRDLEEVLEAVLDGVIVGKALYEKRVELGDLLKIAGEGRRG